MSEPVHREPPPEQIQAHARVRAERRALIVRAHALHETARMIRAESRELVARSVEERIFREHRRGLS
jgi:hypothetical protein